MILSENRYPPPPPRGQAFSGSCSLVPGRRVPKRQETVKVELIDRLDRARGFDALRKRAQPCRLEHRDGGGMQEREVAEPVVQLVIADRGLGIDVVFLGEPSNRGLLV